MGFKHQQLSKFGAEGLESGEMLGHLEYTESDIPEGHTEMFGRGFYIQLLSPGYKAVRTKAGISEVIYVVVLVGVVGKKRK